MCEWWITPSSTHIKKMSKIIILVVVLFLPISYNLIQLEENSLVGKCEQIRNRVMHKI